MASHLYVDLDSKTLPGATAPAELMVVRLDPKSSQFFRDDALLT